MLLPLVLALLVAATTWAASDAARRGRNWLAWGMLVAFTGLIGLAVWFGARRRSPASPAPLGAGRRAAILLSAVVLVFLNVATTVFVVTFLFQVARIEGDAMAPTLFDRDRVLVDKWVYHTREPRTGEIAMHHYPLNPEKTFVNRVMAEEGDQVRIVRGRVHRNDVPMDDAFVAGEYRSRDDWGPQVVPEGYYFVMGDRRIESSDSRHWGFVPKKYIVGRVALRWWPLWAIRSF